MLCVDIFNNMLLSIYCIILIISFCIIGDVYLEFKDIILAICENSEYIYLYIMRL